MDLHVSRLKGRVALIAGGTEGVGRRIVRAFLRGGAVAVVPSSSAEQLERLREELQNFPSEDLVTIFGDIGRLNEAERIRDVLLGRVGRLDAVVASLGKWRYGQSMTEIPVETWQCAAHDSLITHCVIVRTFLPLMVAQGFGSYTLITRTAAEAAVTQMGPNAIAGASQDMLVRVLLEESAGTQVRINEVIVCPDTSARNAASDPSEGPIGDCVGTFTAWLASEEAAPVRGATIRLVERQSVHS
jgi:3-oxoacyl-[acyl-carrier protein] reductase